MAWPRGARQNYRLQLTGASVKEAITFTAGRAGARQQAHAACGVGRLQLNRLALCIPMNHDKYRSRELLQDPKAQSREPDRPAFLSKPLGAPVYHGFPLVEESRTAEGWVFGAITNFIDPAGVTYGDAYVQAPDGSRAGLVWEVGEGEFGEISPPTPDRWGVYAVWLPEPIRNVEDFVRVFHAQLPVLRATWERGRSPRDA